LNGKVSDTVSCRFHLARRSIKNGGEATTGRS
jgi:hypothetical protein